MKPACAERSRVGEIDVLRFVRTDVFCSASGRIHSPRIGTLAASSSRKEDGGSASGPVSFSNEPLVKYRTASVPPLTCAPYSSRQPDLIGETSGSVKMLRLTALSRRQVAPFALAALDNSLIKHLRCVVAPGDLPRSAYMPG